MTRWRWGLIEALDAANRKALVIGVNGTKEAIDAVKAGKLLATGDCDGFLQGCMGTMGAVRHLRNLPVPKEIIFPITVFNITNYQGADVPYESTDVSEVGKHSEGIGRILTLKSGISNWGV